MYLQTREGTDTYCLSEQAIDDKQARVLACHPRADLDRIFISADGDVPVAAVFEQGVPEIVWLNADHPDGKLLRSLSASFPGQVVEPTSWSDDGSKVVFAVRSDRNPGEYYLYDRKTGAARFLLARAQWIDPKKMAQVKPLTVKSRSGAEIYGYLTLPPNKAPTKLPMVVMPHGGPIGPRDHWEWDADAQFLASRGYAVLQVNFHGSGGYGYQYQVSGQGMWGTLLIDDITDMARQMEARHKRIVLAEEAGLTRREELDELASAQEEDQGRLRELVLELQALGVELKDFFTGLVDFRCLMDGREVYLCWRLGEEEVAHWHELDAGFAGRQKLTRVLRN